MGEFIVNYDLIIYLVFVLLGILIFLGILYVVSRIIKFLKRYRHNRLLNSSEYLPEEEIQTLKQVSYLIIITISFVNIIYSIIFWGSDDFIKYFIYYDILASLIVCLIMPKDTLFDKIIILLLIPISSLSYISPNEPATIFLLAIHVIGFAYVIKVYYSKFIHYTESNGLGISILLLFGLIFFSFIFTSFTEGANLLDALVMVSNAFTSNGYAVLGDSVLGKLNSLFLVWGGYILSGVGTATLAAAIISRHFNKKFEAMNENINKLQESVDSLKNEKNE